MITEIRTISAGTEVALDLEDTLSIGIVNIIASVSQYRTVLFIIPPFKNWMAMTEGEN